MENKIEKPIEEKIAEKQDTIRTLDANIAMVQSLIQTTTGTFENLYKDNHGKVNSTAIGGMASLVNSLNNLIQKKNEIQNEINQLIDAENIADEVEEETEEEVTGGKEDILRLIKEA